MMPYRETNEDRSLCDSYRWYDGEKIDIRWSGGWLTPGGRYYPVDYKNGITHETIANEHGSAIFGSGSVTTRPPVMRIFDIAKWMRIIYLEGSSFCVELTGSFVEDIVSRTGLNEDELSEYNRRRQSTLLHFIRDFKEFDSYFINDVQYRSYRAFNAAIRANDVSPKASA